MRFIGITHLVGLLFILVVSSTYAARILGILPYASRSHHAVFQKLMDGLYARGHQLTVVSYFPPKWVTPNYTHISLAGEVHDVNVRGINEKLTSNKYAYLYKYFNDINRLLDFPACEKILSMPRFREFYGLETKAFDLMVVEMYHVHCYLPIAAKHNAPVVWFLAPSRMFEPDLVTGNVNNPSVLPLVNRRSKFTITKPACFFDRLGNTWNYLMFYIYHYLSFRPRTKNLCHKHFDNEYCDLTELYKRVSLVLTYGHSSLIPRPLVPNVVAVGGLHVEPERKLPEDLQKFLDQSPDGVIYVSFGSSLSVKMSDEIMLNKLLETFSKCSLRVLWKCDLGKNDSRISSNVLIRNWVPQRDILAHKNVKVLLTHGGILSIYEAIYTATAIVGIPFYFDQYDNIYRLAELKAGIAIDYKELTAGLLFEAISKVINDPRYRENMQQLSRAFRDRPMSPFDTAMYWIEYVLKHNGASHLRSAAADMPLYQYLLLDIVASIVFLFLVIIYFIRWLIRWPGNRAEKHERKIK